MITDQLLSKATEGITTSRTIRGEIRPLVVSVQANKTEAHGKISTAISESVEQAKKQKVCQVGKRKKKLGLPGRESNPGLPRDRRRYLPLYYRGLADVCGLIL